MSTTYITHIVNLINVATKDCGNIFLFGENIDTGSKISGLAKGIELAPHKKIKNVSNSELTHCGLGLGVMLDGGKSVLFVKQLDFMLLGLDQIVNTYNFIRAYKEKNANGSFTILSIVCDQGYQGPQSSFNCAGEIASIANISVYCINSAADANWVIKNYFARDGFKLICLSQRLFNQRIFDLPAKIMDEQGAITQYFEGADATILAVNFSLEYAALLNSALKKENLTADVFHLNYVPNCKLDVILQSCNRNRKVVIIDDSKSQYGIRQYVISKLFSNKIFVDVMEFARDLSHNSEYAVTQDQLDIDYNKAVDFIKSI